MNIGLQDNVVPPASLTTSPGRARASAAATSPSAGTSSVASGTIAAITAMSPVILALLRCADVD